jgi:hypothetical protein
VNKLLLAACVWCASSPAFSGNLPFQGGWYVPGSMHATCGEANYQAYDWVLGFDSEKGTFGSSDGRCEIRGMTHADESSTYRTDWSCRSTDGEEGMTMGITTDGPRGRILAIDGEPYVMCEPLP